jgi:BirA family biotin operon repressor/biotin-[acetyl-CoA-carboxylase] ligase
MFPAFRLEVLGACGSTNEELFARRASGRFHGHALLALRQTGGIGRRGRSWWSGEGNLALSLGLRLESVPPLLPFQAGLALFDTVAPYLPAGADLRLKWPNDLYLNGRKLAGLLVQVRQGAGPADIVLGIGLNLKEAPPDLEAIALSELCEAPSPEAFAKDFLAKLEGKGFEGGIEEWERKARIEGAKLYLLGEEGEYAGRRLLPSGELEVEGSGGLRRLSSETVSLRFIPPPSP